MLKTGGAAPDFRLASHSGEEIHLYDLLETSSVVLFFYPKAFTPVCTAEACSFRDSIGKFQDASASVLGISSDSQATIERFAHQYQLPFPLLSDPLGAVRRLYGVPKFLGVLAGRATFVISRDRKIESVTCAHLQASSHISESLKALTQP